MRKAYAGEKYKERFSWIDYLGAVRDSELVDELDGQLLTAIKERRTERLHLAAPEQMPWSRVGGFYYPGEKRSEPARADLDIDEYLESLDELENLTIDSLKERRIRDRYSDTDQVLEEWSVYQCLAFDVEHEGMLFVLSGGKWYQVAGDFAQTY